jgi:hypothetical protein
MANVPENEDAIKAEMRLWALEVLVCNLFAVSLIATGRPGALFSQVRQQILQGAKLKTFSGVDPALSDLLSAELETAVDRLLEMASAQIPAHLRGNEKRE